MSNHNRNNYICDCPCCTCSCPIEKPCHRCLQWIAAEEELLDMMVVMERNRKVFKKLRRHLNPKVRKTA